MNLDIAEGIKLTEMAERKRREELAHREWVSFYPHMSKQKSFAEYLESRLPPQIDYEAKMMSKDEIMSELIGKE